MNAITVTNCYKKMTLPLYSIPICIYIKKVLQFVTLTVRGLLLIGYPVTKVVTNL